LHLWWGLGLQNQCGATITDCQPKTSARGTDNLAFYLALLARKSTDLALLVERWDVLPEAIRAGIVAMVNAAVPGDRH
jgi:hypothetical protein